jgi:6-phosphogluconolactonase
MEEKQIFASADALSSALAQEIRQRLEAAAGRDFHLTISGGRTPGILFRSLAEILPQPLACQLHIWWADERLVPPDDPESNYRLFSETFLSHHPLPSGQVHRVRGELAPAEACASLRDELLLLAQNKAQAASLSQPVMDLVLLGAGSDGHTASIFPGNEEIFQSDEPCLLVHHPASGQARVTLSPKALMAARELIYVITGPDKAAMLASLPFVGQGDVSGLENILPAGRIRSSSGLTRWYLDRDAASLLP